MSNASTLKAISSSGTIVDDVSVGPYYTNACWEEFTAVRWSSESIEAKKRLGVFSLKDALITSGYVTIDIAESRMFLNQTYENIADWFAMRVQTSEASYTFHSDKIVQLRGRYLVIGGPIDGAFYHWVMNWCPRLVLAKHLAPHIYSDPDVKFLIDRRAAQEPFVSFLRALDIPQSRILYADDGIDYQVDEAILVSFLSLNTYIPTIIKKFRDAVITGMAGLPRAGNPRPNRRIFISRQKFTTPKRRVANLAAVRPVLNAFNCEDVYLEDMSVQEQIETFRNCELIVGVHGAGLVNIIFCQPSCKVLILDCERNIAAGVSRMFTSLAEVCTLPHKLLSVIEEIATNDDPTDFQVFHNRDVIVDPEVLAECLESLVGPANHRLVDQPAVAITEMALHRTPTPRGVDSDRQLIDAEIAAISAVRRSIESAGMEDIPLDPDLLTLVGMSGQKHRRFANALVRTMPNSRYLEIGVWAGSTLCAALHNNRVQAIAIENWSEFGGPRQEFLSHLNRFRTSRASINLIETDYKNVDFSTLPASNIYFYDGPQTRDDYDAALCLTKPALDQVIVFIVGNWNWLHVRRDVLAAIRGNNFEIRHQFEIRTTLDGTHPEIFGASSEWHNGCFIAVLTQAANTEKLAPMLGTT